MNSTRRFASLALVATVSLLAACGSDDKSDSSPTSPTVLTEGTDATTEETTPVASGGTPVIADGEAPAERTILISSTGFEPTELTIKVGENVTFKGGDDGIYGVIIAPLDGYTVNKGLIETFEFPEAGVYPVKEDISGATAVITVEP